MLHDTSIVSNHFCAGVESCAIFETVINRPMDEFVLNVKRQDPKAFEICWDCFGVGIASSLKPSSSGAHQCSVLQNRRWKRRRRAPHPVSMPDLSFVIPTIAVPNTAFSSCVGSRHGELRHVRVQRDEDGNPEVLRNIHATTNLQVSYSELR